MDIPLLVHANSVCAAGRQVGPRQVLRLAGRLSAPRGGCLKSHRVASIVCGRAAGSGTEEGMQMREADRFRCSQRSNPSRHWHHHCCSCASFCTPNAGQQKAA